MDQPTQQAFDPDTGVTTACAAAERARRLTVRIRRTLTALTVAAALVLHAGSACAATAVSLSGDGWLVDGRTSHGGSAARGLLMNVRMVNAVFEDDRPKSQWPTRLPQTFVPDANTDAFIARIPEYLSYGVRAFTINLQGGYPGYEGAHNSAFNADGSLRPGYLSRVQRVIDACDQRGAVVILGCFYQRQHGRSPTYLPRALSGRTAIRAAVGNVAAWLKGRGYRNVLLEIANEHAHSGYGNWSDGAWLRSAAGQVELIHLARAVHPQLLVTTSGMGEGTTDPQIASASDFLLIHLNTTALGDYGARIASARSHGKPVVVNEDAKVGASGADALQRCVDHRASWGFMHMPQNQEAPFRFAGRADDPAVYDRFRLVTAVADQPTDTPAVVRLDLIDASSDRAVQQFTDGAVIDLKAVGASLNVAAIGNSLVRKIRFDLDNGRRIHSESAAPYALYGDVAGDFHPWTPSLGDHRLAVTPYDGSDVAGSTVIVSFSVVEGTSGPLQPLDGLITSPGDGTAFPAGSDIPITASVTPSSGASITRVEYFANLQRLGERLASPWTFTWRSAPAGSYDLWVRVHDSSGARFDSRASDIVVQAASTPIGDLSINFQPGPAPVPTGWTKDDGAVFSVTRGFGWGSDNTAHARDRGRHADQRYDTLNHLQKVAGQRWEVAVPPGTYDVRILCGDASFTDQVNALSVEGVTVADPDGADAFDEHQVRVSVGDGRLTITPGAGASNAKLCSIEIIAVPVGGG